jgi:hypothetical protein
MLSTSVRLPYWFPDGAVIRVYDDAGTVVERDEHKGDFKES